MKWVLRVSLVLVLVLLFASSQPWQTATLIETGETLSVTGFEQEPQLGLFIAIQALFAFGSRYWSRGIAISAGVISVGVSVLTCLPLFSLAGNSNPELLRSLIAGKTGVADWVAQVELISALTTANGYIWLATACSSALLVLLVVQSFGLKGRNAKKTNPNWVN